jgi:Protein of unknown function (DUF507)
LTLGRSEYKLDCIERQAVLLKTGAFYPALGDVFAEFSEALSALAMQFPREYVAYLTQQVLKRLSAAGLIQIEQPDYVKEVMSQVVLQELAVEDRINDEVREKLQQIEAEMKQAGASYEEMFKKVKRQLVRERKVVL